MKNRWDRAFAAYGASTCRQAWQMYCEGYGGRSIALEGPRGLRTTRQAEAAIAAWEAYLLAQAIPSRGEDVALALRALDRAAKAKHSLAVAEADAAASGEAWSEDHAETVRSARTEMDAQNAAKARDEMYAWNAAVLAAK